MNETQQVIEDTTKLPVIPCTKSIDECLAEVEALQKPIKYSKEHYDSLLVNEINLYQNRIENGSGVVAARERITAPLNKLCVELALLSHRNYKLGRSSDLKPVHLGLGNYSIELTKSDKRQAEDIEVLTEVLKARYKASIEEDEATRLIQLKLAQEVLQVAVNFEKEYQSRINKALENL